MTEPILPEEAAWRMLRYHFHKARGAALIGDYPSALNTLRHQIITELAAALSALGDDPRLYDALLEVRLRLDSTIQTREAGMTMGGARITSALNREPIDACLQLLRGGISMAGVEAVVRTLAEGSNILTVEIQTIPAQTPMSLHKPTGEKAHVNHRPVARRGSKVRN